MDNAFRFGKKEKLCSKKAIEELFVGADSSSLSAYPIRAIFRRSAEQGVRVLVSVSKKRFRHAVDRNRVKRQIREAYRLQKHVLLADSRTGEEQAAGMDIAFIWLTNTHQPSALVREKMLSLLTRIRNANVRNSNNNICQRTSANDEISESGD